MKRVQKKSGQGKQKKTSEMGDGASCDAWLSKCLPEKHDLYDWVYVVKAWVVYNNAKRHGLINMKNTTADAEKAEEIGHSTNEIRKASNIIIFEKPFTILRDQLFNRQSDRILFELLVRCLKKRYSF
jgi:hypothetical protein